MNFTNCGPERVNSLKTTWVLFNRNASGSFNVIKKTQSINDHFAKKCVPTDHTDTRLVHVLAGVVCALILRTMLQI